MVDVDYNEKGFDRLDIEEGLATLAERISVPITGYEEIEEGTVNKVLRLELEDETLLLKIAPLWHNGSLVRERWCLREIASQTAQRVPTVVHYEPVESDVFGRHESLVMEYVSGETLAIRDFKHRRLNESVSQIYANIHGIQTHGYGWLDENFQGQDDSWEVFLTNIHNIENTLTHGPLPEEEYEWLIDELRRVTVDVDPVLLHGDFKQDSFIRASDGIVPIDFQSCFSGDPDYDLGIGVYNIEGLFEHLDVYLESTDEVVPQTKRDRTEKVVCYAMRRGVSVLGRYVNESDTGKIRETEQRYYELKDRYRALSGD